MLNIWTWYIPIEVQKVSPVCFGIWATGNARLTARTHCLNIWRNSDLIRFDLNTDHEPIGDKPLYNNYFVSALKNLRAHMFLNCEKVHFMKNEHAWRNQVGKLVSMILLT